MKSKGVRSITMELDFKGKTAEQLKKEVDKILDKQFKEAIKDNEKFYWGIDLPLEYYRQMEQEKQRLRRIFYEKIDMEFYMDRLSSGFDFKSNGKGKF